MKDYKEAIENIMADTTNKVINHAISAYNKGYADGFGKAQTDSYVKGYEDGKADTPFTDTEEAENKAYERGLNESWECARKIAQTMKRDEITTCFGERDEIGRKMIFEEYTPQDAIRMIKEYEDKQKQDTEIKVGYEVYNIDRENKRIVTAIDGNKAIQLCSNGKYTVDNIDTLHWTGREDLRIKKVLEKITLDKMGEVDG